MGDIPTRPKKENEMRITKHLIEQAAKKGIDMGAIQMVLDNKADVNLRRERKHDICDKCMTAKWEWSGIGSYKGIRFAITTIVCDTCKSAITVYEMDENGCTPLRGDQPNVRSYQRPCGDCGTTFTITARTWEKLREQTTHKCKGKTVDLIADKHRDMKGKYFPKG